jgi:hypothetical protein
MKPPSEQARQVLARYKEAVALGSGEKARLSDVLQERALRGDLPRFDIRPGTPSVPQATLAQKLWASTWAKVGLGLVALGAASGVGYQLQEPAPTAPAYAPSATVVRTPSEDRATPTPGAASSPEVTIDDATPTPDTAAPAPRAKTDKATDATSASAGATEPTIDEEVKLVNGAQAALRAGDTKRALELLSQHAARFPAGKLATLRQVTHMLALCQAGQAPQARREAVSFLSKNPNSPFAERVSGICSTPK